MPGRWLHRLRYFCSDAWDEWRHSKAVNFLALATLAAVLFVAGLAMLVISNVEQRVIALRNDVKVEVYLMDDLADADRRILVAELRSTPGVQRVDYVSRREALRRYRAWAGETAELIDELDSNPLPASLEVVLQPGAQAADTAAGIASGVEGRPGVEDVRFNQAWLHRVESALGLARVGGTALAILIFGAVVFVVASVLRLAVYRRRDEIEVMRLVGATPGFIRGPFLVAGAAQGLIASLVALLLVESIRSAALAYTGSGSLALLELVAAQPLARNFAAILLVVGLFVSLAGSYFSVGEEGASS